MPSRYGGSDRISTRARFARELAVLGRVVSRARESRGVRQSDVAARLGMPPSWLSKIESGTRRVDAIELIRIAEAVGADPAELISELQKELVKGGEQDK